MRVQPIVGTAALLALLGGGYAVQQAASPGEPGHIGLGDQMEERILSPEDAAREGIVIPSPVTTPTAEPEALVPLSSCERAVLARLKPKGAELLNPGLVVDPEVVAAARKVKRHGTLELLANVEIEVRDATGALKDYQNLGNLIVDGGRTLAIKMLIGDNTGSCPTAVPGGCGNSGACAAPIKFQYIGLGTNVGPTVGDVAAQTILAHEFVAGGSDVYARQLDNAPDLPPTTSTGIGKLQVTFGANNPAASTQTIAEAAVFNALSGGTMLARRQGFSSSKAASDIYQITWTFTIS